jgi:hypothetical protein
MGFENRPGQGALFRNRHKGENDNAPNLKGTALLQLNDGQLVEIEISAWTKESEKAGKWLSLNVKPKVVRQRSGERRPNAQDLKNGIPLNDDGQF